ncbi:MAG: lysophospholipid acyltransferase family protein [bacterium]
MIFLHDWYYAIHKAHEKTLDVLRDFLRMQKTHLIQTGIVVVYIVIGFPLMLRTILFPSTIYKNWFYLARAVLLVSMVRKPILIGTLPTNTNFVAVANHGSFFDIFATGYYFKGLQGTVFLHKKLLKIPILGWWLKRLDVIPVIPPTAKYESSTNTMVHTKTVSEKITNWLLPQIILSKREMAEINISAKYKALETLAQGKSLVAFPEGTRTLNGQMKQFEDTAFNIAKRAGVPIVPIAFIGTYEAKPKWRQYIKSTRIIIRIGTPIDGSTMSPKELAEKTQHIIQEMIDE